MGLHYIDKVLLNKITAFPRSILIVKVHRVIFSVEKLR